MSILLLLLACTGSKPGESASPDVASDSASDTATDTGTPDTGTPDSATDTGPDTWRSALYPSDWTPSTTDADGHFLHDFSYAGYHNSEIPLPTAAALDALPAFRVDDFGADPTGTTDSTAEIQAAIDAAGAAGGGVVALSAGTYRCEGLLRVTDDGVVIRGQGRDATTLYFTRTEGMDYAAHLTFSGAITRPLEVPLAEEGAERATTIRVADASGLRVGQEIAVGWVITPEFVEEHGMTGTWTVFLNQWKPIFRREIVAIDTSTSPAVVTVDVPLRYPAKLRDHASLRVESGYLSEVGLVGLSVSNVTAWETAWGMTQTHAVAFVEVRDAFVEGVGSSSSPNDTDDTGRHLISGGLLVRDSKRVTIADTHLGWPEHRGDGGNGYLFEVRTSNEILTRDATATGGRHNFIQNWDFGTTGCVWLRDTSSEGRCNLGSWDFIGYACYSEFHHSLAMANLMDSLIVEDGWQGVNRQLESSGAGHTLTGSVFWNITGGGYLRSLQYGDGYVIGVDGMDLHMDPDEWDWNNAGEGTAPQDWLEGEGEAARLEPPSLFEDQRARRR